MKSFYLIHCNSLHFRFCSTDQIQDVVGIISLSLKLTSADSIPECAVELADFNHDGVNGTVPVSTAYTLNSKIVFFPLSLLHVFYC